MTEIPTNTQKNKQTNKQANKLFQTLQTVGSLHKDPRKLFFVCGRTPGRLLQYEILMAPRGHLGGLRW